MAEDGSVTLAFTLAAFEALADPEAAFADAREWSRYVGVVGEDVGAVERAVGRVDVTQDYEPSGAGVQPVLSRLKWEADTDRYVLVGSTDHDRALADYVGWEYRPVADAARAADWQLERDLGPLARVRRALGNVSLPV